MLEQTAKGKHTACSAAAMISNAEDRWGTDTGARTMYPNIMLNGRNRQALRAASEVFHPKPKSWRVTPGVVWLIVCVMVGGMILLFGARAHGEASPPCAEDYEGTRRATLEHEGRPGVWFAAPVARCILADLGELYPLRHRVELLESELEIKDVQLVRLREVVELGQQAEQIALEGLDVALEARRQADLNAGQWWRSPVLWLAAGAVIGAGLITLAAKVLDLAQ